MSKIDFENFGKIFYPKMNKYLKINYLIDQSVLITEKILFAISLSASRLTHFIMEFSKKFDKLTILFYLTMTLTYINFYFYKLVLLLFSIVIKIPDFYLNFFSKYNNILKNTKGETINILDAFSDRGIITNKLKLFMNYYWQKGGESSAFSKDGINIKKFMDMVGCTVIYCRYVLNGEVVPSSVEQNSEDTFINNPKFWEGIKKILVIREENTIFRRKCIPFSAERIKTQTESKEVKNLEPPNDSHGLKNWIEFTDRLSNIVPEKEEELDNIFQPVFLSHLDFDN
jgi:hypothetical protein